MKSRPASLIRVGLLGGGQLARMLALKGHEIGLQIHVLSANADDPAAQVVKFHHIGDPNNEADLKRFLGQVDTATFESEFLDADLLAQLSKSTGVQISPAPKLMGLIQDRLEQKQLLKAHKLPTADFIEVASFADAERAFKTFDGKFVLKQRRFGYDGYGTFIVDSKLALEKLKATLASKSHGFIAEEFVPFKRELAFMFARRRSGEKLYLPLVETHQKDSRCLWVKGPIAHKSAPAFARKFLAFLEMIKYEGVIGVELFETKNGLIINELAPRVHNSGHYSLDALLEDQFTLHLKSILNLPFSEVMAVAPAFAMFNLLGAHSAVPDWKLPAGTKLHWYGKSENRLGRKMGHINAVGNSPNAVLKKLTLARKTFSV